MHGLLITFTAAPPLAELAEPFRRFAEGLRGIDGFVSKAWLNDGRTVGGFYLFTDRAAAEAYLGSAMVADLQATDGFTEFAVRHFDVIDDLSAMTGIPAALPSS